MLRQLALAVLMILLIGADAPADFLAFEVTSQPPVMGAVYGRCGTCQGAAYASAVMMAYYRIDAGDHSIHYHSFGRIYSFDDGVPIYRTNLVIYETEWKQYSENGCISLLDVYGVVIPSSDYPDAAQIVLYPMDGRTVKICAPYQAYLPVIENYNLQFATGEARR